MARRQVDFGRSVRLAEELSSSPTLARASALIGLAGALCLGLWLGNADGWGIDQGATAGKRDAYVIDLLLIALFGLQHSGMARRTWKRHMDRHMPERSAYLLATTIALVIVFAAWQPLPHAVWEASAGLVVGQLTGIALVGWAVSTLDARAFLGLRPPPPGLQTGGPYAWTPHPIMLGTLLVLWCVPKMSEGHLLFSAAMTAYAVAGTVLESRDLARRP